MCALNEFFVLLLIQLFYGVVLADLIVYAPAGQIQGLSATDGNYSMFLGIPYAKIDINNPFGLSKPQPKFKHIFQADDDSAICPQFDVYSNTVRGTLDCLRLNVYVPNSTNSHKKLPVMVFIPGGGFVRGIAGRYQYGPKFLMGHDVILVVLNHRLGPYGFLCLDIPEVPGNQGLKDQVTALKWVNKNIKSFGGDPKQVTIFGLSSGAISVDFHLMYTDKNLFKQAILQSGTSLRSFSTPDKFATVKLSEYLGTPNKSVTEALFFLATVDPKIVIEKANIFQMSFSPCVEKVFDGVESFITETWINRKSPKVKDKNIMLGIGEYEGVKFLTPEDYTANTFSESLSSTFDFSIESLREMSQLVQYFYLGDKHISKDVQLSLIDFRTDFLIVHPMLRSLRKWLNGVAGNIYLYVFSYIGGRNNGQIKFKCNFNGAIHGDEIGYLFDPALITWKPTLEDQLMIRRITTLWTNFAKYGNPTPETTNLLPLTWTPVSKDHYYYLKMDFNFTMKNSLFHKRMAFWDLFYKLNEKYQRGYVNV